MSEFIRKGMTVLLKEDIDYGTFACLSIIKFDSPRPQQFN